MSAAIALDLGSTSVKAGRLDHTGTLSGIVTHAAPRITVTGEHYESCALDYATTAEQVLHACLNSTDDAAPLGLCSQRSSFLLWEQQTGRPVTPLISWQDNRGSTACSALHDHREKIAKLSGLPLTPYYFGPKLSVLLQENPSWRSRLERGELRAGTLDSFLIWRWTGRFVTDASMAARSQLFDVRKMRWSPVLCELFGIPIAALPEVIPSTGIAMQLNNGLRLQASIADQSAALFASLEQKSTEALVNLGTGGFVIRHLPADIMPPDGYLHTLVYSDALTHKAVEGTLNSIAAALAPYPFKECRPEQLAQDDIYCLAEPSGLGAPYFRRDLGLCFSQPVAHLSPRRIAVLLLEAILFRVARILEEFHAASMIERVYLSGGLSGSRCLQQGIARCVPFEVLLLTQREASLQGAGLLAAGMKPPVQHNAKRIVTECDSAALPEKYRRWKLWLDQMCEGGK